MPRTLLLAVLVICVETAFAASAIYKWTDGDGNIHYEDVAPLDVDVEVLRRAEIYRGEPPPPTPDQVAAAKRAAECDSSRQRLDQVLKAPRLYRLDDQGNRHYLTAQEHQQRTQELRDEVARLCQPPAAR